MKRIEGDHLPHLFGADEPLPALIEETGSNARYAYEEFFAELRSQHTIAAYRSDLVRFLDHAHSLGLSLNQISPQLVRSYLDNLTPVDPDDPPLTAPTKKRALAAIRKFFDIAVTRHAVMLNPALSVRGPKHRVIEGKTPVITKRQAERLFASIKVTNLIGLRDRAILATLIFTGVRVSAVSKLLGCHFVDTGDQWCFRFDEKGGTNREIPCRHDLQRIIQSYIKAAGIEEEKSSPLFRSAVRRERRLTDRAISGNDICRMVKRRLKAAGLPLRLSPHSFRVSVASDLFDQGVPLEDVQDLLGHVDARTTRLYLRGDRHVSRNLVERISVRVKETTETS